MKNNKPILLKIRGGVEVDSNGNKAGKGPLLSEDISLTLGTSQDQYLFQPVILDDQGGQQISVRTDGKSPTLRAETHGNLPCVLQAFGLDTYNQPVAYGVVTKGNGDAFLNERTHTALTAGGGQAGQGYPCVVINLNKGDVQSKAVIDPSGIAPSLYAGECRGGGGELYVCVEENGSRPSHRGDGYKVDDKMYTLNTIDRHAVCYGISSMGSNAMLSDNPHSGIYEAKTSRTLDLNGGNPACNQGGIIVCQRKTDVVILRLDNGSVYPVVCGDKAPTIRRGNGQGGTGHVAVCYWDGGQTAGTLTANNAGGAQRMPDKDNFNCVIEEIKHG